jgi:sulfur carrier protein ThiS
MSFSMVGINRSTIAVEVGTSPLQKEKQAEEERQSLEDKQQR